MITIKISKELVTKLSTIVLVAVAVLWFLGVMLVEPMTFWDDAALAYWPETTIPADPLPTQTNPAFEGVETIYATQSIWPINEYGDYYLYVNTCWLTDFLGPALGHPLLDGVVANDTVAQVPTRGSLVVANATPLWTELTLGAATHILTSDGNDATWAAPVVQTSNLLDNAVHGDTITSGETLGDLVVGTGAGWDDLAIGAAGNVLTVVGGTAAWAAPSLGWTQIAEAAIPVAGCDYTSRAGPALAGTAEDVLVKVVCRSVNGGTCWEALSHPMPVADFVTYTWGDDGAGNLEVRIFNDSQINILCTVSYLDLG